MTQILPGLIPAFLVLLIGFALGRTAAFPPVFWDALGRLVRYLLLPALLLGHMATTDLAGLHVFPALVALLVALLVAVLVASLAARRLDLAEETRAALIVGCARPHAALALALAAAVFDSAGVTLAALSLVAVVPLANAIAASALLEQREAHGDTLGWRPALVAVVEDPLVLAAVAGVLINAAGAPLPFTPVVEVLATPALPLALLVAGGGLPPRPHTPPPPRLVLWRAVVIRLALAPAVTMVMLMLLGVSGVTAAVAVLVMAMPSSPLTAATVRTMGGDHDLIAWLQRRGTAVMMLSLPLVLWLALAGL